MHHQPAPNKGANNTFEVIEWRCENGHLLAKLIVDKKRVVLSAKCHRCKHIKEGVLTELVKEKS